MHWLKRLQLWWLRVGEGAAMGRSLAILAALLTVASELLHRHLKDRQREWVDHAAEWLTFALAGAATVMLLRWFLLRRWWPWRKFHPGGPLTAAYLLHMPEEPGADSPYRFHLADSFTELEPFVSESEYFLGESNPELTRAERLELYKRWLSLNRLSFFYLTRKDRTRPIALSIILPLTQRGYEALSGRGAQQRRVIDFAEDEIAKRGPYRHLLIDTFIISKRPERKDRGTAPVGKGRYGRTLLLRHLALYWNRALKPVSLAKAMLSLPDAGPMTLIAETDKPTLKIDLEAIGFKQEGTSAIKASLYEFRYPLVAASVEQEELVDKLVERIWQLKHWRFTRNAKPGDTNT